MPPYTAAIIGTGDPDAGAGMAYYHGDSYGGLDECDLVVCADVVPEHASAFAAEYDLPEEHVYEDYVTMLTEVRPDVVSVTVPPKLHTELVVGAARTGIPDAIHCEKPMAATWGGSQLMEQACRRHGIQLTFNHQRRFAAAWQKAKTHLDGGVIGDLRRVETGPPNFFDWGTHAVDLCNYLVDDRPVEWVLGNLDYQEDAASSVCITRTSCSPSGGTRAASTVSQLQETGRTPSACLPGWSGTVASSRSTSKDDSESDTMRRLVAPVSGSTTLCASVVQARVSGRCSGSRTSGSR